MLLLPLMPEVHKFEFNSILKDTFAYKFKFCNVGLIKFALVLRNEA